MTTTQTPTRSARPLIWAGVGALIVGGILAFYFSSVARNALMTAEFSASLVGGTYDPSAASAAMAGMWVGIVVAVIGVGLVVAGMLRSNTSR